MKKFFIFMVVLLIISSGFSLTKNDYREVMSDPVNKIGSIYSIFGTVQQIVYEKDIHVYFINTSYDTIFILLVNQGEMEYVMKKEYVLIYNAVFLGAFTYSSVGKGAITAPAFYFKKDISVCFLSD